MLPEKGYPPLSISKHPGLALIARPAAVKYFLNNNHSERKNRPLALATQAVNRIQGTVYLFAKLVNSGDSLPIC